MRGSRNKFQWEGGPGLAARKQSGQRCFFSPQLILQLTEGVQWFYYRENDTFSRIQRGSNIFRGGGGGGGGGGSNFFQGGPNAKFYRTHITCDFPGWGPDHLSLPSGSAHDTGTCTSQESGTV